MSVRATIFRHALPRCEGKFSIPAHGFKPLSVCLEDDIAVMYEIGIQSDDDSEPYPHHYIWIPTLGLVPNNLHADSFLGTVRYADGVTMHLFQDWRK